MFIDIYHKGIVINLNRLNRMINILLSFSLYAVICSDNQITRFFKIKKITDRNVKHESNNDVYHDVFKVTNRYMLFSYIAMEIVKV